MTESQKLNNGKKITSRKSRVTESQKLKYGKKITSRKSRVTKNLKCGNDNYLPEVEGDQRELAEVSPALEDVSPVDLEKDYVGDDVSLDYHLPWKMIKMTGGTPEVRSDKSLTLLKFYI